MPTDTARKIQEREDLSNRIKKNGYIMDSCSNCIKRKTTCWASANDSRKCAGCVKRKLKCDCMGPDHPDWVKLEKEEERLDREEEETLAKLVRLRKQKRLIRTRGKDMLRRGLKTLDELDAAEEAERVMAEKAERALEAEPSTLPTTGSGAPLDDFSFVNPLTILVMSLTSWEKLLLDASISTPRVAYG